jgi:hypothetical protein
MCVACWPVSLLEQFINRMAERPEERLKIYNNPTQKQLKILSFNYASISATAYFADNRDDAQLCLPISVLKRILALLNDKAGVKYSGFLIFEIITVAEKTRAVVGTAKPRDHLNDISQWFSWEEVRLAYDLHGVIPSIITFQDQQIALFNRLKTDFDQEQDAIEIHTNEDQDPTNHPSQQSSDPISESLEGLVDT